MQRILIATVAVFALVVATAAASTTVVKVDDSYFQSADDSTVTVERGDIVRWSFVGRLPHGVRVVRGPVRFRSLTKTSGSYARRMSIPGTYTIFCSVHGSSMAMRLIVEDPDD